MYEINDIEVKFSTKHLKEWNNQIYHNLLKLKNEYSNDLTNTSKEDNQAT